MGNVYAADRQLYSVTVYRWNCNIKLLLLLLQQSMWCCAFQLPLLFIILTTKNLENACLNKMIRCKLFCANIFSKLFFFVYILLFLLFMIEIEFSEKKQQHIYMIKMQSNCWDIKNAKKKIQCNLFSYQHFRGADHFF